jgi:hypothetical protein
VGYHLRQRLAARYCNDTIDGQHIGVHSGETPGPEFQSGAGRLWSRRLAARAQRAEVIAAPLALQNDLDVKEIVNL